MIVDCGARIWHLREVEEVLYQHPAVSEVTVVALPDPKWIEVVRSAVRPRAGTEVTADELIAFARERIAGCKVPKSIVFVEALPKQPSGKILKRELRSELAGQASAGL